MLWPSCVSEKEVNIKNKKKVKLTIRVLYPIVLLDDSIVVTSAGRFLAGARASGVQALAAKAEVSLPSFFGLMLFPLESPACLTIRS